MSNDPLGLLGDDSHNDPLGLLGSNDDPLGILNKGPESRSTAGQAVRNFIGGNDAALNIAAQLPAMAVGGAYGLGTLLSGQGIDKATANMNSVVESNFGFGAPKPFTPEGQQTLDMLSHGMEGAVGGANELVSKATGSDAAGNLAAFGTEMALNLAPIPGGKGVRKIGKAIENRMPQAKPEAPTPNVADAFEKPAQPAAERVDNTDLWQKVVESGDQALIDRLQQIDNEINSRQEIDANVSASKQELAQRAIDRRQADVDYQVKRQQTIDFNAAERARQERAPTGVESYLEEGNQRVADAAGKFDELQSTLDAETAVRRDAQAVQSRLSEESAARDRQSVIQKAIEDRQKSIEQEMQRRVTLEQGARDAALPDQFAAHKREIIEGLSEHPQIKSLGDKIAQAEAKVVLAAEKHPVQALKMMEQVDSMERKLNTVLDNLTEAKLDTKYPNRVPRGQRGAVNASVFKEGFEKLKQLADGTWLRATGMGRELNIEAIKDSHVLGRASFSPEYIDRLRSDEQNARAYSTVVNPEHRGKGVATEIYRFMSELGNDIQPAETRTPAGKAMWDSFQQKGMTERGVIRSPGNKQRGAIWVGEPKPRKKVEPMEGEQLAKKLKAARVAAMVPAKVKALDEFREIKTPEEALALSATAKDIPPNWGQRYLGSGVNFQVIMSNNPALKYLRTVARDARTAADKFSRDYITNDKRGISPMWTRMSDEKRIQTMQALFEGDRVQQKVTPEIMDKLGFDETQRQFVETFYEANDKMHTKWNEERAKLGFDPIDYRQGHVPGIFTGAYKSVVMEGTGNKARAIGVITADTAAQLKLAKQYVMDNYSGTSFVDKERSSLVGATKRYYSDIFSGMTDVLDMLGQSDPRFKEVQEIVGQALRESNNKLFAFNVHELHKKGVFGNEGNRPWKDAKENANDAFKAVVRYFEEGSLHHEMQVPLDNLRQMMASPEMEHMPNAKEFMKKYIAKMTGDDVAPLGAALNTVLDHGFKLIPHVSWNDGKVAGGVGVGPSVALGTAGAVKNFMSQYFMGWFNYMFTAAQLAQPLQTGTPFMQLASSRLGLPPTAIAESMGKGGAYFNVALLEKATGKKLNFLPEHHREAFKYAEDRGLLTFSEIEKAYQGTQNAVSRYKDQLAEANMKVGEFFTRAPMFMSFVDMLVKSGVEVKDALPIAENLTQFSMIDYHQWERPMLYSAMGVTGQFAGGLTTFKHGYMSQQLKLAKEGIAPTKMLDGKSHRQFAPLIMSTILSSMIFAGITGTPFYGELDQIYSSLTNTFGKQARSIREDFLETLPEWMKTGLVSNAVGLNLQGKFSAADMLPDSPARALSPQLEGAWRIAADAVAFAKEQNDVTARNFAISATPSGWKGVPEALMSRNPDNYVLGRDGLIVGENPRSKPIDSVVPGLDGADPWKARAATGLRPQPEAIERERLWNQRKTNQKDVERRSNIAKEYKAKVIAGETNQEVYHALQQEYMERGGDPKQLIDLAIQTHVEKSMNEKQRLQGVPSNSLPSIHRYQNFNR